MSFRIGQKVVCVNNAPMPGLCWNDRWKPTVGNIYTISASGLSGTWGNYECVRLVEGDPTWRYRADRFRPLIERNTDISIFTEMLTPKRVNELV